MNYASLPKALGYLFEDCFERSTGLINISNCSKKNGENLPHFESDSFFIETKAGYYASGPQIKEYQIEAYPKLSKPLFYFLGFHRLHQTKKDWMTLTHPIHKFRKKYVLSSVALVSDEVIQRLFIQEKRLSKKTREYYLANIPIPSELPNWYFSFRERLVRQLVNNESISRKDTTVNSQDFYNIHPEIFFFEN